MQRQGLNLLMSLLLLLAALFLSACHSNNESNLSNTALDPVNGNPGIIENKPVLIEWQKATQSILAGKVKQISQTHDLQVNLELKTGAQWQTFEPSIDAVFRVINECGKPCKKMILATE